MALLEVYAFWQLFFLFFRFSLKNIKKSSYKVKYFRGGGAKIIFASGCWEFLLHHCQNDVAFPTNLKELEMGFILSDDTMPVFNGNLLEPRNNLPNLHHLLIRINFGSIWQQF